jgi:very-short-patch-repair endonuclease
MTPQERCLWDALRHDALGVRVRRQHPALGYILDFYIPRCLLAIEVDGTCHDPVADAARDAAIATEGVRVLRFSNDAVEDDLPAVLATIRAALQRE